MSDLTFVQADDAPSVSGTLTNPDGTPFVLTGATVRFQMRLATDRRFAVDAVATITDDTGGLVRYDWAAGDLAAAGDYVARWKIILPGGDVQHSDPLNTITVAAQ